MKHLWAPWRMEYIGAPPGPGCLFCNAWKAADPRSVLVLAKGRRCLILLNRYPYNSGHLMVAPVAHVPSLAELDRASLCDVAVAAQVCEKALAEEYKPQGFNIGSNIGAPAGAGVAEHVHLHLVPRWAGDTNFMPVLGETKVLPESLEETYDRLRPVVTRLLREEGL
jgi:ATP adenylyltransferase